MRVKSFVAGVTAAATGAITGSVFQLGRRAITDIPTLLIALVALAVLLKVKQVPEPLVIAVAAGAGILLKGQGLG